MPSPRALLVLSIVGALCLAASCAWLGYHLADRFLHGSDGAGSSSQRRSALEEVKRLRQGTKNPPGSLRVPHVHLDRPGSSSSSASASPGEHDNCNPPPASPGEAMKFIGEALAGDGDPERLRRALERDREREAQRHKKDEL